MPARRYIIVGAGPAGVHAAIAIRSRDQVGEIVVIDRDHDPPYYRTELDTYVGGSTSDAEMPLYPEEYYREQRIRLRLRTVVAKLRVPERTVELAGGERMAYDALLLAPGSYPLTISCPGASNPRVVTVRTWEDARKLIRLVMETDRPVVVVGGGVLGLILAEGVRQRGRQVTLLEREPRLWAPVLDETASQFVRRGVQQRGIEILLGEEVAEIVGADGKIDWVATSAGRSLEASTVVVAIGVRPDVAFLDGSTVRIDRGILIDHEFRTNVPDVFAAGDAVQGYDPISGQFRVVTNWNNAVEQGKLAGGFMAGDGDPYRGVIVSNSETFCGVRVTVLGLTQATGSGLVILKGVDQAKGIYRKLTLRDEKLVGALLVGNTSGEGMMKKMILEAKPTLIAEVKSKFLTGLVLEETGT
jgi:NAD(P)H-nitrite reductase large subunit